MKHIAVLFESGEMIELQPVAVQKTDVSHNAVSFMCGTGRDKYIENVNKLLAHIRRGDIYEINYCIEFFAENVEIDPHATFRRLKELTEAPFAGLYKAGDIWIICASPERFIKKTGDKLVTQPMKGTAKRGNTSEEDLMLKKALAQSLKEQTENVMAVDVARNDLSIIARKGTVVTDELFGVQTFKNVHQMVSTVSCELKENTSLPGIMQAVFPPASMTGAPKIRAVELIKKYELSPRKIYSGCIGKIEDNGDFDFCVVIRSIIYDEKKKRVAFHVGSAVTAACDPAEEWEECLLKANAMLLALGTCKEKVNFGA
ncbi:MAG: chorismate-binding protein [Bacteroidia bacterium]